MLEFKLFSKGIKQNLIPCLPPYLPSINHLVIQQFICIFLPITNIPFISLIFLKRSLVFPILLFSSIHLHSEKAMAPHSSTLPWKVPWMEEPGRLQSMGSLRVAEGRSRLSDFSFTFHSPLSLSSRGFLVSLHFLP